MGDKEGVLRDWKIALFLLISIIILISIVSAVKIVGNNFDLREENSVSVASVPSNSGEVITQSSKKISDEVKEVLGVKALGEILNFKDITYDVITKEEYLTKNNIDPQSIGCWDCDNRNYEEGDLEGYCSCDEWEKCEDYYRESTAYNFDKNPVEVATDYCSGNDVREMYIDCYYVDEIFYTEKDCNDYDYYGDWEYYCDSDEVKRKRIFYDYGCGNGECHRTSNDYVYDTISGQGDSNYCELRKQYGCTLCAHEEYDCDSDSECSGDLKCIGPDGDYNSDWYDGCCNSNEEWDVTNKECLAPCLPHDYYSCYSNDLWWYNSCDEREKKKTDCGNDECSGWGEYCSDDDIYRYRECHDRGCSGNACFDNVDRQNELVQDCGADGCDSWGSNYCKDNDVYHSRTCHDRGCSGGNCFDNPSTEEGLVEDCGDDSCGSWSNFCKENDLYKKRTCYDKGCSGSSCFSNPSTEEQLVERNSQQCITQDCSPGSGPCCDTSGNFRPTSYKCQEDVTTDYECVNGNACGQDVFVRHQDKYCSGSSSACNGNLAWDTPIVFDDCTSSEKCANDDSSCNYDSLCVSSCTPGTKRCNGNIVEQCKSDGSGWQTIQNCGTSSYCASTNPVSCITCDSGKLNCDQNPFTGCEVNKLNDNNNCGGCGIICTGGKTCQNGECKGNGNGENLVINGDFSSGTNGWALGGGASYQTTEKFIKISGNGFASQIISQLKTSSSKFKLTFKAKKTSGASQVYVGIQPRGGNWAAITSVFVDSTSWKTYELIFDPTTWNRVVGYDYQIILKNDASGEVWYDDISLVEMIGEDSCYWPPDSTNPSDKRADNNELWNNEVYTENKLLCYDGKWYATGNYWWYFNIEVKNEGSVIGEWIVRGGVWTPSSGTSCNWAPGTNDRLTQSDHLLIYNPDWGPDNTLLCYEGKWYATIHNYDYFAPSLEFVANGVTKGSWKIVNGVWNPLSSLSIQSKKAEREIIYLNPKKSEIINSGSIRLN